MKKSNYDKTPFIAISNHDHECWSDWDNIAREIQQKTRTLPLKKIVIVVECYSGIFEEEIRNALTPILQPTLIINSGEVFHSPDKIEAIVAPDLGGEDPIFGFMTRLSMDDFLCIEKINQKKSLIESISQGIILIIGSGACKIHSGDILVYADMPRWEGQLRQRRNEVSNLGVENKNFKASLQYKRSFFIDWRVCDRWKRETMAHWDYLLDTTRPHCPKMITGNAFDVAMKNAAHQPLRLVPFFDPGPWGGQWMKSVCDLPDGPPNYAWCFDCVPEENSMLLKFGETIVEIPSLNLVFHQPQNLLGERVYARFGAEFPIRFDFLDTMDGGNLSFQVHPLTDYAREHFGLSYTQDESYYILDAKPGAEVYLGCKNGTNPEEMIEDLQKAQKGEKSFDDQKFAARFPAKKHDHFLIPAGTLHCSGANSMVLEISATPYIFTFKLWDWNRLGLDGLPRPVNIERGKKVIQWNRDEDYARKHLVNQITPIAQGEGWNEEKTGLHEAEFIETRRHWFTVPVIHQRTGSVEVLNLVEGSAVIVESTTDRFKPFEVHYAETFVLPVSAGDYLIRPKNNGERCGTLKAYVRG